MRLNIKKAVAFALVASLTLGGFCGTTANAASKVKLNKKSLTMSVGDTFKLKVKGTKLKVKWKSSKTNVASVTKGKVKAKKAGKTVITAQIKSKTLTCKVTVKKKTVKTTENPIINTITNSVINQLSNSSINSASTPTIGVQPSNAPTGVPTSVPTDTPDVNVSTTSPSPDVTEPPINESNPRPDGKNESDLAALQTIIKELRSNGAKISEDIDSQNYMYEWDFSGRLTGIDWKECNIQGEISLAGLPELTKFHCYYNEITGINLSENTKLRELQCSNNKITALDVSNNIELTDLYCFSNNITDLNVSHNPQLSTLQCSMNDIEELDLLNNIELSYLDCRENNIAHVNITNTKLMYTDTIRTALCDATTEIIQGERDE